LKAQQFERMLLLADRNNLVYRTLVNDFKPLGSIMFKIRSRKIGPTCEINWVCSRSSRGRTKQKDLRIPPDDFINMIVIDDCHRLWAA
jgi:type I site-specific restriction endonuclease